VEAQPGGTSELHLELNGRRVSRIVIIPMLMRIGAAVVRMDGIGGVSTDEAYRNRGYSRRVMETALEQMRSGDAALSTLFGIQDFYQKFGYETTGPEYTVVAPFQDAKMATLSLPPGWIFRSLTIEDMPAVMRLYHANTRRATGALVRHDADDDPTETERLANSDPEARKIGMRAWNRLRAVTAEPSEDECRVLVDDSGRIAAYAWFGANKRNWWMSVRRRNFPNAFHIAEPMARDPAAADVLLAACRIWATDAGNDYDAIGLAIPPEGMLAWAAAYQGGQLFSAYTRGGDFMGRVVNVESLLRQMLPEFIERVRNTGVRFYGQLKIVTEEGGASMYISPDGAWIDWDSGGKRLTAEMPQAVLARLCLGGFDTGDILSRLPTKPTAETAALLNVLFPRRAPHIYPVDRF
jgi:hypothetical protein